mgnify:CR=1 FL=1
MKGEEGRGRDSFLLPRIVGDVGRGAWGVAAPPCYLHEADGVGRQQLLEAGRHLVGGGGAVDELVQQRLEHEAVGLVHQRDLWV